MASSTAINDGTVPSGRCSSSHRHGCCGPIDGDSDGTADPDDLDDATATAARYLCADGNRLSSHRGWIDAVASYNHDEDYVRTVAEEANRLASS